MWTAVGQLQGAMASHGGAGASFEDSETVSLDEEWKEFRKTKGLRKGGISEGRAGKVGKRRVEQANQDSCYDLRLISLNRGLSGEVREQIEVLYGEGCTSAGAIFSQLFGVPYYDEKIKMHRQCYKKIHHFLGTLKERQRRETMH